MEIENIKISSFHKDLLAQFLGGKTLPISFCEKILTDISSGSSVETYSALMEKVKKRVNWNTISKGENVVFVSYYLTTEDEQKELSVLVRLINIRFGSENFIVLNHNNVIYVPPGSKINNSVNELSDWLSKVTEKHLARIKMSRRKQAIKSYVTAPVAVLKTSWKNVKTFFKGDTRTQKARY